MLHTADVKQFSQNGIYIYIYIYIYPYARTEMLLHAFSNVLWSMTPSFTIIF